MVIVVHHILYVMTLVSNHFFQISIEFDSNQKLIEI